MDRIAPQNSSDTRGQPTTGWLSKGGVSMHGVSYGPPGQATEWGIRGCPVLPRIARERLPELELPSEFNSTFSETLTPSGLDRDVLARYGITELPESARKGLRDFLYGLDLRDEWVAIPAGVPLPWLERLPLSGRTRNALIRAFHNHGVSTYFDNPVTAREFLAQRSVGKMALNELMCVIESAELHPDADAPSSETVSEPGQNTGDEAVPENVTPFAMATDPPMVPPETSLEHGAKVLTGEEQTTISFLINFAKWAMAETDAANLGEAIVKALSGYSESSEWNELSAVWLAKLASPSPHPYEILRSWAEQLPPRQKIVFAARIAPSHPSQTLEALAHEFGVTRERVRQIEVRTRKQFESFANSSEAKPVIWKANSVRARLGIAAPETVVDQLLKPPDITYDYRAVVLNLAGPYRREEDGWLVRNDAQAADPTPMILEETDEFGGIDEHFANSALTEWGLGSSLHNAWLLRHDEVRQFNGKLVKWGRSIPDRMAFALADLGRPATIETLMAHVAEETSRNSAINSLREDPRVIRTSATEWALASWGLPAYTSTAQSIRHLLEEAGGSCTIDQMVRGMDETFGVSESTTRAYCYAPMFVRDGEWLRLRTDADETYRCDADAIQRTPRVFDLRHGHLGLMIEVDENTLRGSGMMLSEAAGAILKIQVNESVTFSDDHGTTVSVTFPETSIVGPSLGSVRNVAMRLGTKAGDYLTLVLDRSDMSVKAEATERASCEQSWETIGRLTGIGPTADLDKLAAALHCADASEVRGRLRQRGDSQILQYLPRSLPSSSLDQALTDLEDQVQRTRRGQK